MEMEKTTSASPISPSRPHKYLLFYLSPRKYFFEQATSSFILLTNESAPFMSKSAVIGCRRRRERRGQRACCCEIRYAMRFWGAACICEMQANRLELGRRAIILQNEWLFFLFKENVIPIFHFSEFGKM